MPMICMKTRCTPIVQGACLLLLICGVSGCVRSDGTGSTSQSEGAEEQSHAASDSSRIAVPGSVRQNLGVSFVQVEARRIEQTLRVPGRFEYLPTARREYRLPVSGRVELKVEQFQSVREGDTLYSIESLEWREHQQLLSEARAAVEQLRLKIDNFTPLLEAHLQHESSLENSIVVLAERVTQLERVRDAGGGRVDEYSKARAALAIAKSELASLEEKHVEFNADREQAIISLQTAIAREGFLLGSASTILGVEQDEITRGVDHDGESKPWWATVEHIEVRATRDGIVESLELTNGSWAEQRTQVLRVVRPEMLRFRASALQSDLGVLRAGLDARIVPASAGITKGATHDPNIEGTLTIGLSADPEDRTINLFVVPGSLKHWARQGVSAHLEIVTDVSARPVNSIPLGVVQRDGLIALVFVRDPFDPDVVIRKEVTLGSDDGQWVEVLDGVELGQEIVLDGAFQLLLASSSSIQKGGHFHSDGTFHEGED